MCDRITQDGHIVHPDGTKWCTSCNSWKDGHIKH